MYPTGGSNPYNSNWHTFDKNSDLKNEEKQENSESSSNLDPLVNKCVNYFEGEEVIELQFDGEGQEEANGAEKVIKEKKDN